MTDTITTTSDRSQALTKAALRAAEILGLDQATFAKVLGVSPASISRMYTGEYRLNPDSKEWELATLLVRLYRGLDTMMASDEVALRAWMQQPNIDLDAIPTTQITHVTGLVQAVAYVDAYRVRA